MNRGSDSQFASLSSQGLPPHRPPPAAIERLARWLRACARLCLLAILATACNGSAVSNGILPDAPGTEGELSADVGAAGLCDDVACRSLLPCMESSCDPSTGQCLGLPLPDGSPCDDSDPCTMEDRCTDSVCTGKPASCPPPDSCHLAACSPENGQCVSTPLSGPSCDDLNPCTTGDSCVDGQCLGTPVDCDDDNPCTSDSCDPKNSSCSHVPLESAPCDDHDPCTEQDLCLLGSCAGTPRACDDGNACTSDFCISADGDCGITPLTDVPCDDGDLCTHDDVCIDGTCAGAPIDCDDGNPCSLDLCLPASGCLYKTPVLPCDDGNPCTHSDACAAGECLGQPLACHDANPCTLDSCDPVTGECLHLPIDWPCDDASLCTTGDVCVLGACVGQGLSCDDGNPCTTDSCQPQSGCTHSPLNIPCDDGNGCTVGDLCTAGACQPGKGTPSCDDGNPCTSDSCSPEDGSCKHLPAAGLCSDGNPCTIDDHCQDGECTGSDTDACQCANDADCAPFEDGNKCNGTLFCDKAVLPSKCKLLPGSVVKCSTLYDTPCRKALCQADSGICLPTDLPDFSPCNDGNPCTTGDHCFAGECAFAEPISCDDGNLCTSDSCDPKKGCQWDAVSLPCNDSNLCTLGDTCQGGNCIGIPVFCEDANPCTTGVCDPNSGKCSFVPVPSSCNDGNPCTTKDQCTGGICSGQPVSCDDGLSCTEDACNLTLGCLHTPLVGDCDDGDGCTADEVCKGTKCVGVPITCFDANPCTDDLCAAATGCVFKPNMAPCDDGNACTYGDMCKNGVCAGLSVSCDDGNPCTASACHPVAGCVTELLDKPCTDYSPCTLGDWCKQGACVPGFPTQCDDGNLCTLDFCDPDTGKCAFEPNGLPCDDGSSCTTQDHCSKGVCTGFPIDCTDLNPCTADSCVSDEGCLHQPTNGAFCDDLDLCTQGDICVASKCLGPIPTPCNDANPCTLDGCLPATGCTHKKLDAIACSDQDPATLFDSCVQGKCTGLPDPDLDGIPDSGAGEPCAAGQVADCSDNCPALSNPAQEDADIDAIGDACEQCGPPQPFDGATPPDPALWKSAVDGPCPEGSTSFAAGFSPGGAPALELSAVRQAQCTPAPVAVTLGSERDLYGESTVLRIDFEWESVAHAAAGSPAARLLLDDGSSLLVLYEAQTHSVAGACGPERRIAPASSSGQFELRFSHVDLTVEVLLNGIGVPGSPFDLSGLQPHWLVALEAAGASFDPACSAHATVRLLGYSYVCK